MRFDPIALARVLRARSESLQRTPEEPSKWFVPKVSVSEACKHQLAEYEAERVKNEIRDRLTFGQ